MNQSTLSNTQYTRRFFTEKKSLSKDEAKSQKFREVKTMNGKLIRNASETAAAYLRKIPEYSVLQHQITALEAELKIYEKNKDKDLIVKTSVLIKQLKSLSKEMTKILKGKDITDSDKKKQVRKPKSDVIIQLEERRTELAAKRKQLSANDLIKRLKQLEQTIEDTKTHLTGESDFFDLDGYFETSKKKQNLTKEEQALEELNAQRNDMIANICKLAGIRNSEFFEMSLSEVKELLRENLKKQYDDCMDEINTINMKIAIEKDKINDENSVKLTDLVFSVLESQEPDEDLKNPDSKRGKQAREMLAVANIPLVNSIANYTCKNYNLTNLFDDAVSAGLLGLTQAINVWYQKQILFNEPLPFKTFAAPYITNKIKEELSEIGRTSGKITGTNYADKIHYESKRIENFMKANKDLFADMDEETVKNIISALKDNDVRDINSGTTQTDLESTVTGGEQDADVWSNISVDETYGIDEIIEMKSHYKSMMESVYEILSLMNPKSQKPLFNIYERRVFLLEFGLYKNIFESADGKKADLINAGYTQQMIAEHITKLKIQRGELPPDAKVMSQAAVSAMIKTITDKLQKVVEERPELKEGFEYFATRRAELNVISQEMEKSQINHFANKIAKNSVKLQNEEMLDYTISSGSTIGDIINSTDYMEDNEIFEMFDELLNLSN